MWFFCSFLLPFLTFISVSVSHSVPNSLWPHGLQPIRLLCPWDFPGKDTGVGCHFLLQGLFPTQGSNPGLLHCRQILYRLSYKGSPWKWKWSRSVQWTVPYQASLSMGFSRQGYWSGLPFSSPGDLPSPGIEPQVSCTAGRFFTDCATREALFMTIFI